jgi:hypothetical protein
LKRYCTLRLCSPKKLVFKKNFVFFDKLRFEKQRYFLSTGLRFARSALKEKRIAQACPSLPRFFKSAGRERSEGGEAKKQKQEMQLSP